MLAVVSSEALLAIVVPTAIAILGLAYHAGQMAEKIRDGQRRLDRLERHMGFWEPPPD